MSVPTFDPVRVPMSFRCGDRMIRDLSTLPILSQTSETDTRCNTFRQVMNPDCHNKKQDFIQPLCAIRMEFLIRAG